MLFILVSSIGGFLFALTGMSIGWMIGTMLLATVLSYKKPTFMRSMTVNEKGLSKFWLWIGQCILGIELGQQINLSVLQIFMDNSIAILSMLFLSIIFSVLSGYFIWKYTKTDLLTSFYGTAPGGLTAMPAIAEEVGANTAVVSIIQTMRVFLVILSIPLLVSSLLVSADGSETESTLALQNGISEFEVVPFLWTLVLALSAWGGALLGKRLNFPAPWVIGSMLGVALVQTISSSYVGHTITSWWPSIFMILAQIFIAASIGSSFNKSLLIGIGKTVYMSLICTIALILAVLGCSFVVAKMTGISFVTATLAFAPGGIAEMATTSILLDADSTFVVAVQVLRIIVVLILLPPFFKYINHHERKKVKQSSASV
ncbi:AbrB family transcriptional regulator [Pseudalkalibacillus decolorationis]|uniref:AbrB family transcriptional regulator n=1 Tax=Pseudalkalibacillus decolorationis TaxID=163879 RepID=UPI0021475089|nr:AbrB family transcriptional regulator [Pseudalkalibacillus decolorationis]